MTRVCLQCGWLVFDGHLCERDGSLAVEWRAAARACGVPSLRRLLNIEPELRVARFRLDRDRRAEAARRGHRPRPLELEVA